MKGVVLLAQFKASLRVKGQVKGISKVSETFPCRCVCKDVSYYPSGDTSHLMECVTLVAYITFNQKCSTTNNAFVLRNYVLLGY